MKPKQNRIVSGLRSAPDVMAGALLLMLALAIAPGVAFAHARVITSTPTNGSTVAAGLTQITVAFSEEVSPDQSTAQLVKGTTTVSGVTVSVNRAARKNMTIATPVLGEGQYQVKWQVVTDEDNGHTSGTFSFTVSASQSACTTFKETGKTACGKFLAYWNGHRALTQQGYPISGEMQEKSDTDGKTYTVQYFERAVFEMHPENAAPYNVQLSLLGNFLYKQKYATGAPGQKANTATGSALFPETGKRVGGLFLDYWQKNGGLAQQGYPISEEFQEKSELDGKTYTVQYFERAVFEMHPENAAPYNVLLSQLGTFRYKAKYPGGTR